MEHAAGVRYRNSNREDAETVRGCPVLVRYADDWTLMVAGTRNDAQALRVERAETEHEEQEEGLLHGGKVHFSRRVGRARPRRKGRIISLAIFL